MDQGTRISTALTPLCNRFLPIGMVLVTVWSVYTISAEPELFDVMGFFWPVAFILSVPLWLFVVFSCTLKNVIENPSGLRIQGLFRKTEVPYHEVSEVYQYLRGYWNSPLVRIRYRKANSSSAQSAYFIARPVLTGWKDGLHPDVRRLLGRIAQRSKRDEERQHD